MVYVSISIRQTSQKVMDGHTLGFSGYWQRASKSDTVKKKVLVWDELVLLSLVRFEEMVRQAESD